MFQFRAFPSYGYEFTARYPGIAWVCSHIRRSPDHRLFAAPRSFSQLVTSFIGSWCQGIPLALLLAWPKWFSPFLVLFQNYAGSTDLHKIVFTLIKSFHNAVFLTRLFTAPSVALLFFSSSLFSFQGANKDTKCTLKIEQCKNLRRSDLGMLHRTCDPVRSP